MSSKKTMPKATETKWFKEIENYIPPKEPENPDVKPPEQKPSKLTLSSNSFFITKELYDEFEARRKKEFPDIEALAKLNYNQDTGEVTGSNSFIATYFNSFLPEDYRTSNPLDLENILRAKSLKLEGHYIDSALVLRDEKEPNQYLAQHLMKQVKARLRNEPQLPLLIPLYGLELQSDQNSPPQLSFVLKDNAELIYAPVLKPENNEKKFSQTSKSGLPSQKELDKQKGKRYLWTASSGLCRFYLNTDLDLNSYVPIIPDSNSNGRVVVVGGGRGRGGA